MLSLVMIDNVNCDQIKCYWLNSAGRQSQRDSQSRTQGNGKNEASDVNNVRWTFFLELCNRPYSRPTQKDGFTAI